MNSIRKTLVLACAVSVLGLGTAFAQTDPNAAPAAPAAGGAMSAPAGGAMAAPAGDASGQDMSAMPKKKHMAKKHMSKKMMKKKAM